MPHWNELRLIRIVTVLALVTFAIAGMIGGPGFERDVATIHALAADRDSTLATAIPITQVGGAPVLLAILLIAACWVAFRTGWRPALSLGAIVIGGRIAVELLKLAIERPRPQFLPYPVPIASLSFPSGHSANSMITFLALAILVAPERWRIPAVAAAITTSVAIGATRPMLGVHWPTDVIGGWAFGILWVIGGVALSRRVVPAVK